jgi:lysophospholipase L1-like esterase
MAALLAIVVTASTAWTVARSGSGASAGPATPPPSRAAVRRTAAPAPPAAEWRPPADGSLGDPATTAACGLLTRGEIARRFGGPVGEATPEYPYCRWAVGGGFVGLRVAPHTPVARLGRGTPLAERVTGLGPGAFFGTNRFLYFPGRSASYWLLWQRPGEFTGIRSNALVALARIVRSRTLPNGLASRPDLAAPPLATNARETLGVPTRADPVTVWFAGDSLAAGPSWAFGLGARAAGAIRTITEYQVGTGLVRDDYWDWYRHAVAAMAAFDPDVAVFMAGGNDGQPLLVDGSYARPGSAAWTKAYARRVGRVMDVLAANGRPAVWVGMPPMRDPGLNASARRVDAIARREARRRPAVAYLDAYAMFAGRDGRYTDRARGRAVRLVDGVHLNVAGSELLAEEVLRLLDSFAGGPGAAAAG